MTVPVSLDDLQLAFNGEDLTAVVESIATDGNIWRRAIHEVTACGLRRDSKVYVTAVAYLIAWEKRGRENVLRLSGGTPP